MEGLTPCAVEDVKMVSDDIRGGKAVNCKLQTVKLAIIYRVVSAASLSTALWERVM